jgi:hypothetical protein
VSTRRSQDKALAKQHEKQAKKAKEAAARRRPATPEPGKTEKS